jgi:hypothetical protein
VRKPDPDFKRNATVIEAGAVNFEEELAHFGML